MTPLNIENLQQQLHAILAADSYFTAETLLLDNGLVDEQIEAGLAGRGAVIVVTPVLESVKVKAVSSIIFANAVIAVDVMVNPFQNSGAGGSGKAPIQIARRVALAVQGRPQSTGQKWFEFEGIDLTLRDPGLIAYEVRFSIETKV